VQVDRSSTSFTDTSAPNIEFVIAGPFRNPVSPTASHREDNADHETGTSQYEGPDGHHST